MAARELTMEADIADYFEAVIKAGAKPKLAANWTREEAIRMANEQHKPLEIAAPIATMAKLVKLVEEGKVARVVAKMECPTLFASGADPEQYFTEKGMIQIQDAGQLTDWVKQAIAQEPKAAADVQSGKMAAIGRLLGVTMKLSGGKTDPNSVRAEVMKQLGVGN
jgi:aspartyl-tRNA(Asn)/glutamyl-tRNA(Gln) amidotransferase subunit B